MHVWTGWQREVSRFVLIPSGIRAEHIWLLIRPGKEPTESVQKQEAFQGRWLDEPSVFHIKAALLEFFYVSLAK